MADPQSSGPEHDQWAKAMAKRQARRLHRQAEDIRTRGEALATAAGFERREKCAYPEPASDAGAVAWWKTSALPNIAAYVRTLDDIEARRAEIDELVRSKRYVCVHCRASSDPKKDAVLLDHVKQVDHIAEVLARMGFVRSKK